MGLCDPTKATANTHEICPDSTVNTTTNAKLTWLSWYITIYTVTYMFTFHGNTLDHAHKRGGKGTKEVWGKGSIHVHGQWILTKVKSKTLGLQTMLDYFTGV